MAKLPHNLPFPEHPRIPGMYVVTGFDIARARAAGLNPQLMFGGSGRVIGTLSHGIAAGPKGIPQHPLEPLVKWLDNLPRTNDYQVEYTKAYWSKLLNNMTELEAVGTQVLTPTEEGILYENEEDLRTRHEALRSYRMGQAIGADAKELAAAIKKFNEDMARRKMILEGELEIRPIPTILRDVLDAGVTRVADVVGSGVKGINAAWDRFKGFFSGFSGSAILALFIMTILSDIEAKQKAVVPTPEPSVDQPEDPMMDIDVTIVTQFYGEYQEYGTSRHAAHPFIRPVLDMYAGNIQQLGGIRLI